MSAIEDSHGAGALEELPVGALLDLLADRIAERLASEVAEAPPRREPWVGVEEAAAHIGASKQRIYDLVNARRIPHRKEGRRLLFRLGDLDDWLEQP